MCKGDGLQLHIQLLASYKLGLKNVGPNVKMHCVPCWEWGGEIVKTVSGSDPSKAC